MSRATSLLVAVLPLGALVACGSRTGLWVDLGGAPQGASPIVDDATGGQDATPIDAGTEDDARRTEDATIAPDVAVPAPDAGTRDARGGADADTLVDANADGPAEARDANALDAPFNADACPVCVAPFSMCKMAQGASAGCFAWPGACPGGGSPGPGGGTCNACLADQDCQSCGRAPAGDVWCCSRATSNAYQCCAPGAGRTRCCPPGVGSISTGCP